MLTAARVGGGAGIASASVWSTPPSACMVGSSVVAMGLRSESSLWSLELRSGIRRQLGSARYAPKVYHFSVVIFL